MLGNMIHLRTVPVLYRTVLYIYILVVGTGWNLSKKNERELFQARERKVVMKNADIVTDTVP